MSNSNRLGILEVMHGRNLNDAESTLMQYGFDNIRVIRGRQAPMTAEYVSERINLVIENDRVVEAYVG